VYFGYQKIEKNITTRREWSR